MTDTATQADSQERQTPTEGVVVDEIPTSTRQGFWATEFEWFKSNPGTIKKYENVSPTTASYLRETYGLDAHSRNTRGKRCDLFVRFLPDQAEAIKNRPKRPRKAKADNGKAPAKSAK